MSTPVLTSKKTIKQLCEKYQIFPSKHLGQNFLIDKLVLKKIISTAAICPKGIVLEIGPGFGVLTQELAKKAKKVIAIEKDKRMIALMRETLKDFKNIEVINEDILKLAIGKLFKNLKDFKVVANLPFYLTQPVIRKLLESAAAEVKPLHLILIVQKEVAQRIMARPPKMNLLAVAVQFYAQPKIISYISKKSFWPSPKVNSAIIKIIPNKKARSVLARLFFRIVKAGFSQPRKQLVNNLSDKLKLDKERVLSWLGKNNIKPERRAQSLAVSDWIKLTRSLPI